MTASKHTFLANQAPNLTIADKEKQLAELQMKKEALLVSHNKVVRDLWEAEHLKATLNSKLATAPASEVDGIKRSISSKENEIELIKKGLAETKSLETLQKWGEQIKQLEEELKSAKLVTAPSVGLGQGNSK